MDDAEPERHFYEQPWFKGIAAIVALVGAVLALVGPPSLWAVFADLVSGPDLPASNTEIVLDASAAMAAPLGAARTKLDAAADAVGEFAVPFKNEGLALRGFGGGCDEAGRLLVDFGEDHGDEVRDAAARQQAAGDSNLTNAVIAAIDDFADTERFPDPDSPKRVIVFAGTIDDCRGSQAAEEIRREVERTEINAVFKLVGLKVSPEERERFVDFKRKLGRNVDLAFADTEQQLAALVDWLGSGGNAECADGADNDGDGLVDEVEDPGCAADGTEADALAGEGECADGVDNDGDGLVDEVDDPGCAADGTEADGLPDGDCADGVDNDGDGLVDATDPSCADGTEEPADGP